MNAHRPSRMCPDENPTSDRPYRTYQEVAQILGIHWTSVQQGEARAMRKLATDPVMRRLFEELD